MHALSLVCCADTPCVRVGHPLPWAVVRAGHSLGILGGEAVCLRCASGGVGVCGRCCVRGGVRRLSTASSHRPVACLVAALVCRRGISFVWGDSNTCAFLRGINAGASRRVCIVFAACQPPVTLF